MPRHGQVRIHTDEFCREHGDGYYMYAEGHVGNAEFLVLRNPETQPPVLPSWTWVDRQHEPVTWTATTHAATAPPVQWWESLLENDFEEDTL